MFGLGVKVLQSTYVTDDSFAITLSRNRLLKYSSHVFTESAVEQTVEQWLCTMPLIQ